MRAARCTSRQLSSKIGSRCGTSCGPSLQGSTRPRHSVPVWCSISLARRCRAGVVGRSGVPCRIITWQDILRKSGFRIIVVRILPKLAMRGSLSRPASRPRTRPDRTLPASRQHMARRLIPHRLCTPLSRPTDRRCSRLFRPAGRHPTW